MKNSPPYEIFTAISLMPHLLSATIRNYSITEIPENAFRSLFGTQINLTDLNIVSNKNLNKICNNAFQYLPSLLAFGLFDNNIDYISANAFNFRKELHSKQIIVNYLRLGFSNNHLNQAYATFILTYLFGALAIKNSFTVFDLWILLITGRTKLSTFVVAVGRKKEFRGSRTARGTEVAQAWFKQFKFRNRSSIKFLRPTRLILQAEEKSLRNNITYLDHKVFEPFSNDNRTGGMLSNRIQLFANSDCNDCRNYWLPQYKKYISKLSLLDCIDSKNNKTRLSTDSNNIKHWTETTNL